MWVAFLFTILLYPDLSGFDALPRVIKLLSSAIFTNITEERSENENLVYVSVEFIVRFNVVGAACWTPACIV